MSSSLITSSFACLLWALGHVASGSSVESEHAIALTQETFDEHLEQEKKHDRPSIVMFHAPWCSVCQRTMPKFIKASDRVHDLNITVGFAHVDCTEHKPLCQRFEVKGFPSIKFFSPKNVSGPRAYRGARNEDSFVRFAERMSLPTIRDFYKDVAGFEAAMQTEVYSGFVAFVPSGAKIPDGLAKVADTWADQHVFAVTDDWRKILPTSVESSSDVAIAAISMGSQQWSGHDNRSKSKPVASFYKGSLDDSVSIDDWVRKSKFLGITSLGEDNFYDFTHANKSAVLVATRPDKVTEKQETAIRKAVNVLSDKFLFGVVDGGDLLDKLTDFNIKKSDLPRVLVIEDNMEVWVEDSEALRFDMIEEDLKALLGGAPLLRQRRDLSSSLRFYRREFYRLGVRIHAYASKGMVQTILVLTCLAIGIGALLALCWGIGVCMQALLFEGADEAYHTQEEIERILREKKRT